MSQARITVIESFAVRPDELWNIITDHEGMSDWSGARVSVIAGPSDGGVGTVRRVHTRGLSIDEEVTYADRPRRLVYRVVRGLPIIRFHRGEVLIEPSGSNGSRLTWDILLDSWIPGVAKAITLALEPALRRGLSTLRESLAGRRQASSPDVEAGNRPLR
jgi:hypothetical protein